MKPERTANTTPVFGLETRLQAALRLHGYFLIPYGNSSAAKAFTEITRLESVPDLKGGLKVTVGSLWIVPSDSTQESQNLRPMKRPFPSGR
jgi:hypothetical protein